nr:L-aspartate oxidase [Romeria gracilis]
MTHAASRPLTLDPDPAFDVLVIGGGAAGLYSALCLPASLRVGLVAKDQLSVSASDWAQGGIAAAIAPEDSPELHIADTLRAGAGLCDRAAVIQLVKEARDCIESLIDLGVAFDRQDGDLAMTLEAAHSRHRVLHAADTTGRAIVSILSEQVLQRANITVLDRSFVLDLWLNSAGHCQGICRVSAEGQIRWTAAKAIVLATGGGGQVFAHTTNPEASTGDGVAMAWRAGARLRDLEFFQFHPTALSQAGAPRFLISEAVRGEGAHLIDWAGRRFAFDFHPDGELAPRDVVSRAIYTRLQNVSEAQDRSVVWLDLSPIEPDQVRRRFPNIVRVCQRWGIDVFNQPIPVSPAAHYWMGGIVTDLNSQTTLPRLYAVGENASTGVHGANRLASNSLLECLVFGAQLRSLRLPEAELPPPAAWGKPLSAARADELAQVQDWRSRVPDLVWQSAGICRESAELDRAIAQLQQWRREFERLSLSQMLTQLSPQYICDLPANLAPLAVRQWGETRNLFDIADLILQSAAFRTESRGGHYRRDFPQPNPAWQAHTLVQGSRCWRSKPLL